MFEIDNRFDPEPSFYDQFVAQKFRSAAQAIRQDLELAQRPQPQVEVEQQTDQPTQRSPDLNRRMILGCY